MPDGTGAIALSAQNGRIQSRTKRAGVCETSRLGGASPALSRDGDSPVRDWMASAIDLAKTPRLRDGKVDIGAYQCWLDPVGFILKIQ